ncbi:DUF58 domain-containing protein [Agaribacter flavus]|uniref:DUF58 domain-containing protein n=1 Tax=Agaribacter flavus TaxID=1902781 RepID=A0ABV7FNF0_9ALTE
MILSLKKRYWALHYEWVVKRADARQAKGFGLHNTFILPTSFGWSTIAVAICLFVLGTNYQNNIVLSLSYFIIALNLLSLFHNYFFFTQYKITVCPPIPDYANRKPHIRLQISSSGQYLGGELNFIIEGKSYHFPNETSHDNTEVSFDIRLPKQKRGLHDLGKVTVNGIYGFGLFKCWSYIVPKCPLIVYPAVEKRAIVLHHMHDENLVDKSSDSQLSISDNLQGIRQYQKTDPLHHVSWKHLAKGLGLLSKDFNESKGVSGWLRLKDHADLPLERALSVLCFQVQELSRDKVSFGLDLGDHKILPNLGEKHLQECLLSLAKYPSNEGQAETREAFSQVGNAVNK